MVLVPCNLWRWRDKTVKNKKEGKWRDSRVKKKGRWRTSLISHKRDIFSHNDKMDKNTLVVVPFAHWDYFFSLSPIWDHKRSSCWSYYETMLFISLSRMFYNKQVVLLPFIHSLRFIYNKRYLVGYSFFCHCLTDKWSSSPERRALDFCCRSLLPPCFFWCQFATPTTTLSRPVSYSSSSSHRILAAALSLSCKLLLTMGGLEEGRVSSFTCSGGRCV